MTSTRHSPPKDRRVRRGLATVLAGVMLACTALPLAADQTQFPFSGTVTARRNPVNPNDTFAILDGTGAYLWTDYLGTGVGVAFAHYLTVTSDGVITSYAGTHAEDFDVTDQWAADDSPRLGYYGLDHGTTWGFSFGDILLEAYDIDDEPLGTFLLDEENDMTWGWSGWFMFDATIPGTLNAELWYDFDVSWIY